MYCGILEAVRISDGLVVASLGLNLTIVCKKKNNGKLGIITLEIL